MPQGIYPGDMLDHVRQPQKNRKRWFVLGAALALLVVIINLVIGMTPVVSAHFRMEGQLASLEAEFVRTAEQGKHRITLEDIGGEIVKTADYHGALERILARRDTVLERNGYTMVGSWWARDGEAYIRSFYLKR